MKHLRHLVDLKFHKTINDLLVNYGLLRKDYETMAKIYFNRMLVGTIIFDAIKPKYQNEVREYGIEYVKAGKMSKEEYEMLYKEEYPEAQ